MSSAESKLSKQRLAVLELAEVLGNISEACRRRGMSRSQFYEWKRRFQTHGLEGLKDLPPIHKSHPQATPQEMVDQVLALSEDHPTWGCKRLAAQLKIEGRSLSNVTIQKILIKNGLGSRYERLLKLEQQSLAGEVQLSAEEIKTLEHFNPCFKERHVESSCPGELLNQDTFYVGHFKGIGKLYLQSVVDTYGSYAFGYLHTGKLPSHAAAALHMHVLPQYQEWGIAVHTVLTDNGSEYRGTENHPYELYLELNSIEHRRIKVNTPRTNGFVERFNRTVLDEFFRIDLRKHFYTSVEQLQASLDAWLKYYNEERPHLGYRNNGNRPLDTVKAFIENVA